MSFDLGGVQVDPPLVMAPMADITDVHFHEMLRQIGGPGLYVAEMVRSKSLADGCRKHQAMLRRPADCDAFAVQVYGADPDDIATAAMMAADAGADVVDMNMGCPAKKITGKLSGSGLLRDIGLVARIFATVRRRLDDAVPLTVKIRTGWDESRLNYLEVGRLAEAEGLAALTLHGRTRKQMFDGEADWGPVAELAASLSIPVIGNGDVRSAADALSRLESSGCAGVMIARGALADPWIFHQARALLAGRVAEPPTLVMRRRALLDHCDRLTEALPERAALHRMRKLSSLHLDGIEGGAALRRRLFVPPHDLASFRGAVDRLFGELAEARAA